jgi:hypothetical protein
MPDQPPAPDLEAWMDAALPVLGIAADPAYRPGILQNLQVTLRMASLVLSFPLDEREEPAPVYEP